MQKCALLCCRSEFSVILETAPCTFLHPEKKYDLSFCIFSRHYFHSASNTCVILFLCCRSPFGIPHVKHLHTPKFSYTPDIHMKLYDEGMKEETTRETEK